MPKQKVDGVVEAVHYADDGRVEWVRAYLRRGPIFSDRVMIDRQSLVDYLKSGKNIFAGQRIALKASTFELTDPLSLISDNGTEILVAGNISANQDTLDKVPII